MLHLSSEDVETLLGIPKVTNREMSESLQKLFVSIPRDENSRRRSDFKFQVHYFKANMFFF